MPDGNVDYAQYLPEIDVNDGLKRVLSKKKLYFSLLGRFDIPKMTDNLLAAIQAGEHTKVVEAAHAIKGASGNLGLTRLKDLMLEVETKAKASQSAAELSGDIKQIADKTAALMAKLIAEEAE